MNRRALLLALPGALAAPACLRAADAPLRLRDLYRRDRSVSDLALGLEGRRIAVAGFMAPPLKAEAQFFVLTRRPMSVCPFCETSADWPDDILAVYTKRTVRVVPFNVGIEVSGRLELGARVDAETGFLSMVRLGDASYG